jgi:glutamyl-Q tRNA(Asp) synthetase
MQSASPPVCPEGARPIGRFAPSPTGPLHLGSLVSAVGSWVFARRAGGTWLVRIEDLDPPRVVPGCADDLLRTLDLLGLHWDGEVVRQSRRTEAYEEALGSLVERGLAYACGCSRGEVARASTAPHGGDGPVYPGTCRSGLPSGKAVQALRVRVPDDEVCFSDGVAGVQVQSLGRSCGDFVVRRADGPFAYQLAVVVDDAAAGVTQVVRGADLLASTPRQVHLQTALGQPIPAYWHLPLVTDSGGAKLSKRDAAVSLAADGKLRESGGALLLGALRFLGQAPPSELSGAPPPAVLEWARTSFEPSRIPTEPGPFLKREE